MVASSMNFMFVDSDPDPGAFTAKNAKAREGKNHGHGKHGQTPFLSHEIHERYFL
jgi:hypothetical protein